MSRRSQAKSQCIRRAGFGPGWNVLLWIACSQWIVMPVPGQGTTVRWATQVGGEDDDCGLAIATDTNSSIYVAGYFNVTAGFGPTNILSYGGQDIFVTKYSNAGDLIWARQAGGTTNDQGRAISVDPLGNVYVAGHFRNTGAFGSTNVASSGLDDIFVGKMDSAGNWLWVATGGGATIDEGRAVAVDILGNCYVSGVLSGTASFGNLSTASAGQSDVFIAKCDSSGRWLWATAVGGPGIDEGHAVAVDAEGNCYVTGSFGGVAIFGSTNLTSQGGADIFLAKLDGAGAVMWVRQAGGTERDAGNGVILDSAVNVYVTGGFGGTSSFGTTNVTAPGFAGTTDIFLAKFDSAGRFLWVTRAGGNNADAGNAIALDTEGSTYVTGLFLGTAFFGSTILTSLSGQADVFFAKYSPAGTLAWAFQARGPAYMTGHSIAVDHGGSVYGTGFFRSHTSIGGVLVTNHSSSRDGFVVRSEGPPRVNIRRGGTGVLLSWPAWATGYELQSAAAVSANAAWSTVTNTPQLDGEQRVVGQGAGNARVFYRLRRP